MKRPHLPAALLTLLTATPVMAQDTGPGPFLRALHAVQGSGTAPFGATVHDPEGITTHTRAPLGDLIAKAGADRVELTWPLTVQLGPGLEQLGVTPLAAERQPAGLPTGQGVVVGIVDTGIDWTHPDFRGEDGPRIEWLLDLSFGPREGAHPGVDDHGGALWSRAELTRALLEDPSRILSTDLTGHGTHVAGLVGGRGADTGLDADGVAPDITFIIVKASQGDSLELGEEAVLNGVEFILERAEAMGAPAVVNLSLGGHSGPHDGSTPFERALTDLFDDEPGRALVVAAGNDGGRDIHARGALGADTPLVFDLEVPAYTRDRAEDAFAAIGVWYDHDPDHPVEIEVITPEGRSSGVAAEGELARVLDALAGSLSVGHGGPSNDHPAMGNAVAIVQEPVSGALPSGTYQVILRGGAPGARADAWVAIPGAFGARFGRSLDPDVRITVPGTVGPALVVGALNSRTNWTDRAGRVIDIDLPFGAPSFFSGTGPTRDARPKPDVLAPGLVVASAMAQSADPANNPASIFAPAVENGIDPVLDSGIHAITQGTSMSAAFAAGAAALLLEKNPTLTSPQIADLLRTSATNDAPWSTRSGFGTIDIPAALALSDAPRPALSALSLSRSLATLTRDVVETGGTTEVIVSARDADGQPLESDWIQSVAIEVQSNRGEAIVGDPRDAGGLGHTIAVPIERATAQGSARIVVRIDGQVLDSVPEVTFVDDRGALGGPTGRVRGGGGCASANPTPGEGQRGALWIVLVWVAVVGSRRLLTSGRLW